MNTEAQATAVWMWAYALITAVPMALSGLMTIYLMALFAAEASNEPYVMLAVFGFMGLPALGDLVCVVGASWVGWRAWNGDVRLVRPAVVVLLVMGGLTVLPSLAFFSCCGLGLRLPAMVAAVVALLTCPRDLDRTFGVMD
ncbi:MAG: hypothetical protein KC621_25945 [Myxococcales bacterium]|nr:hypothetical protein [Myxococcales bacterium]